MKIIDFHSHVVPARYPAPPNPTVAPVWPVMEEMDGGRARMVIGGKPFRMFDSIYWDLEKRICRMDAQGVAQQVVSPLPELLSYWLPTEAALHLTGYMNATIADLVKAAPGRFIGMGAVALQDVDAAIRQLESLRPQGLVGVHVGSNVNGRSIADANFHPFFEAVEALDMTVLVHGVKPGGDKLLIGPPALLSVVGVPHETAMAITSFIMTDILGRYPKLKLVFSHGGGTLGSILDRLALVWGAREDFRKLVSVPPAEYARRFFYDTAVFEPRYLAYLKELVGADRLVAGTDGPADLGQQTVDQYLQAAGFSEGERRAVGHANAERLLQIRHPN